MNASQDCNYSVALSDDEEYKARKIQDMKEPKYHLRRGQVHGIEDRMTFLTYDRDKYGQLKPVKNIKRKNGVLVEIDPNFYRTAQGGYEEDLVNKNLDRKSLNKSNLTYENLELLQQNKLGLTMNQDAS